MDIHVRDALPELAMPSLQQSCYELRASEGEGETALFILNQLKSLSALISNFFHHVNEE